jgi:hypothetical protein
MAAAFVLITAILGPVTTKFADRLTGLASGRLVRGCGSVSSGG